MPELSECDYLAGASLITSVSSSAVRNIDQDSQVAFCFGNGCFKLCLVPLGMACLSQR